MKGISAWIAVVLLVGFTVGVGTLIITFITGLTTTSTGITSNQSESLSKCAGAWLHVYDVQSSRILYSNPNRETVTSVNITTGDGVNVPGANSLAPGATASTIWTRGTNTSVTLRGLCQSIVTAEGVCKQGQACWSS